MNFLLQLTRCFLLFSLWGCSTFYYHPDSIMYYRPEKLPIIPSQHELIDEKGRKIVGWYFKNKNGVKPKARILFFHGNAQNISSHFVGLYWILEHEYDFFIFDYPGYGGSSGEPTRDSVVEASYASLKWLNESSSDSPIAVFGQSLGGNIALFTVAKYQNAIPVCQVTIESSFLSYRQVGKTVLAKNIWTWPLQWLPYLLVTNYNSASKNINKIAPTPLLVLHGDDDPVVDFSNGEELFKAAGEPKEFIHIDGGLHIDAFTGPQKDQLKNKYLASLAQHCSAR